MPSGVAQPRPTGPLPTGKITEAQADQYPETQKMDCLKCGKPVLTPKNVNGVTVICGGCGNEVEALPF